MSRSILAILGVIVIVIGITASQTLFSVHQTEQALILQLGKPVRIESEPGLKVKVPFVQNVTYYDRRILDLDPPVQEVILLDQKRINLDSFARYRIVDPLMFRQRAGNDANFRNLFGNRLNSAVRAEVAQVLLPDLLNVKRADLMERIATQMRTSAPEFGVEVVDVRIGRTDLPEATSQAVYNRMRSDRIAQAAKLRAEGEEDKLTIQADADRQRTIILAEARKQSEILHGDGEAFRTTILNDAYGRDEDFFDFFRSMETLGLVVDPGTTMVLSPESDLFQFFRSSPRNEPGKP